MKNREKNKLVIVLSHQKPRIGVWYTKHQDNKKRKNKNRKTKHKNRELFD